MRINQINSNNFKKHPNQNSLQKMEGSAYLAKPTDIVNVFFVLF